MPGASFAGTCYATTNEANNAYFQGIAPVIQVVGSDTVVTSYQGSGSTWALVQKLVQGSTETQVYSIPATMPTFAACDTPNTPIEAFQDGQVLGWGVALAMAVAWGVMMLRRGL